MKKIVVVFAAALMMTAIVSCGNKTAGVSEVAEDSTAVDSVAADSIVVVDSIVADTTAVAE